MVDIVPTILRTLCSPQKTALSQHIVDYWNRVQGRPSRLLTIKNYGRGIGTLNDGEWGSGQGVGRRAAEARIGARVIP
jgi:hypothetical protein